MLKGRKAQAATELAVLGSLIIIAFAFLINFSEKLNRQQSYLMQTFRQALKEARAADNSASYTKVAFRRMPNVASPMELGQLQSFSNSASVLWATGKGAKQEFKDENGTTLYYRDVPGVVKYQLNEAASVPINQTETLHNLIVDLKIAAGLINATSVSTATSTLSATTVSRSPYADEITILQKIASSLGKKAVDTEIISGLTDAIWSLGNGVAGSALISELQNIKEDLGDYQPKSQDSDEAKAVLYAMNDCWCCSSWDSYSGSSWCSEWYMCCEQEKYDSLQQAYSYFTGGVTGEVSDLDGVISSLTAKAAAGSTTPAASVEEPATSTETNSITNTTITKLEDIEEALAEPKADYTAQAEALNETIIELEGEGADPETIAGLNKVYTSLTGTTETTSNIFINRVNATTTFRKEETPAAGIVTFKTLDATDALQANVTIGDNQWYNATHYLGPDGKYYPYNTSLYRIRERQ